MYLCLVVLVTLGLCTAMISHGEKSECREMMDVIITIDGSDSIASEDYTTQKKALKALVQGLGMGPKQSRIGIVVYSSGVSEFINLTDNKRRVKLWIDRMSHPRDGTMTSLGIAKAREMFKQYGRKNVPSVGIVITDGISKHPNKTAHEAQLIRDEGVSMFAVGISHDIHQSELEAIASDPSNVLMLKTFDQLNIALSRLMKVVCPCPEPDPISYAIIDVGFRSIGSIRRIKCKPGYQPMGNDTMKCLKNSKWSPVLLSCLECPPPPVEYGYADVLAGRNKLDTIREYKCKEGYASPYQLTSQCVPGPKGPYWTTPNITCLGCPPIRRLINGYHDLMPKKPEIGTLISYKCNPGYIPTGPIDTVCISEFGMPKWSKFKHRCISCKKPPRIRNARLNPSGNVLVNSVRVYQCNEGYHATGTLEAVCMGEKGATYWHLTGHKCKDCTPPPHVPNAKLITPGNTLVKTIRMYTCLKGFQRTGPIKATCVGQNGVTSWDGPYNRCVACAPPPEIDNAIANPIGDTLVGSIRSYKCKEGYVATGPMEVGCIEGTGGPLWTGSEFHCVACDPPKELPFAILDPVGKNLVGHQRRYHCVEGFVPTRPGPVTITCIGEYKKKRGRAYWGPPSHLCSGCGEPPHLDHAEVLPGKNTVGSKRLYKCTGDFHETGPMVAICQDNAEWLKPKETCAACAYPPDVNNAEVLPGDIRIGAVRRYRCLGGLIHNGKPVIECLPDAKWSSVLFKCVGCKRPPKMDFAELEPGKQVVGAVRLYICKPGYMQTGPIRTTCAVPEQANVPGWSRPVHYCKDCGNPHPVENADFVGGPRTLGSTQKYVCRKGFAASGSPYSFCMSNAEWSPPRFKCVDKKLLEKCLDIVGEMYKLTFDTKDHCVKPTYNKNSIGYNPHGP